MEPRRTHPLADERGISTTEYAVLFVLILVGLVGAWKGLNNRMNEHMTTRANRLDSVVSIPGSSAVMQTEPVAAPKPVGAASTPSEP